MRISDMVYYIGITTALAVMVIGIIAAGMHMLMEKEQRDKIYDRMGPAIAILIGCNIGAVIILGIVSYISGR